MATIIAAAGGGNWTVGTTWVGNVAPTAADDAQLTVASGNVTIDTGAVCRSLDCNTYTGTLTHTASVTLTIGDGTAGAGNIALRLVAGMTYTLGGTSSSSITFVSTSATTQTMTFGGKTTGSTIFQGTGSTVQFADAHTTVGTVTLTLGTLNTNGQTCSWGTFSSVNSNVRTLTLGASAITLVGAAQSWTTSTSTNLTITANTAVITQSGAASTINTGSLSSINGASLVLTGSGVATVTTTSGFTWANFTRTGTAAKTDTVQHVASFTVTGTYTLTGNSVTNRVLAFAFVPGTPVTITAAVVSLTNGDFTDITGAGAATWTGTSLGNALGNSNITFDAPTTQTYDGTAGNWSTAARWTSRVPLPQDTVAFAVGSGALTVDMPRLGADINFTNYTGTATLNTSGTNYYVFGSLTISSGMTWAQSNGLLLAGRSSHTLTSSGKTFGSNVTAQAPSGTYTLQDAFITAAALTINDGTFTTNNFNVTCSNFSTPSGRTCVINGGTSTFSLTITALSTAWFISTGATVNMSSSTIVIATASTNARTFAGFAKTYGTLTYTVANSPGSLTITSANTFTTINGGSGRIITMPSASTQTVTNFNVNGAVNGYVYLPGVASNYASAPDSAALSITGDIDIRVRSAADDWTPTAITTFVSKYISGAGNQTFVFYLNTSGTLVLQFSVTGASLVTATSTSATGFSDGAANWIRVTRNSTSGDIKFYTAADSSTMPSSWTQLGTTVTTTTGSLFDSGTQLEIGTDSSGANDRFIGKMYQVQLRNNILDDGTGIQFDADFTTKTVGANTFTESSANAATVTINGTLAQAGDGRVSLVSSTGASAATMTSTNQQSVSYLSIQDSTVDATPKWYAGVTSTNVSGNTNWLFIAAQNISDTKYSSQEALNQINNTGGQRYSLQEIANMYNGSGQHTFSFQEVLNMRRGVAQHAGSEQQALYENLKSLLSLSGRDTQYSVQQLLNMALANGLSMAAVFK